MLPAGTAGNVIASRLTEDPTIDVLVIEAGLRQVDLFKIAVLPSLTLYSDEEVLPAIVPWLAPGLTPSGPLLIFVDEN